MPAELGRLGLFSMEIKIATGCWRQELEPFPGRSGPLPTPSSLLESLGLSPICKMTVRGEGKGIFLPNRRTGFGFLCHGIREKHKTFWKETPTPFESSLAALPYPKPCQNSNSYIQTDFTSRKHNMELLLLPFLTSLLSFAPSCLARPSRLPGAGMEVPLEALQVSPDLSLPLSQLSISQQLVFGALLSGIMDLPSKGTGK